MKKFMDEDFLLEGEVAKDLYFNHAKKMPIFDFHCHLNPKEIYEDKKYENLTEVWLGKDGYGDHYKWRLLRAYGVEEEYITGDKSPEEKFLKYAEVMPYLIGNPIHQWTHLELQRYFDIYEVLTKETAPLIYKKANEILKTLTARKMMEKCNVKTVFTTDDPIDDLHYHELMKADKTLKVEVAPCFRPDKAINLERDTFLPWLNALSKIEGHKINSFSELVLALRHRVMFFSDHGCVASDHALDIVPNGAYDLEKADLAFKMAAFGKQDVLSRAEIDDYKTTILIELAKLYKEFGIVQQYHIGAFRNANTKAYKKLGPDTGYDCIQDYQVTEGLKNLLDTEESFEALPKTVLYDLKQSDNEVLTTLMNCYQEAGIRGKIQFGSAWWFNDHYDGMSRQMETLASDGLLSAFIGMLTDSRSFLSYPRHEYFRRLLCNRIGQLVEKGMYPDSREILGQIVEDISYNNAVNYFKR